MNEKEFLIESIENFISDMDSFRGNTDTPKLIVTIEMIIASLKEYIVFIKSGDY